MRVVITGATGNIGTSLIERLAADDDIIEIVAVSRRRTSWSPAKTMWSHADVAVDDLAPVMAGADAVVHLAWSFHPTHDPQLTWRNNVIGSTRVFEAAARAGAGTLVHSSSIGAYSPAPDQERVTESWPTDSMPTAAYGREKAYVERVLDRVERDEPAMRIVRLRPGFIFKRSSATEQRRLFAGPLVPNALVRPGLLPLLPSVPGLRFQSLHSHDAAEAFRQALVREVRGAFNIAAEPIVDAGALAELFDARVVRLPLGPVRALVAAAWHLHLVPASPHLLDLLLSVPVMDTNRARTELGWTPRVDALSAIAEVVDGMREGAAGATPPLHEDAGGPLRVDELRTGVGERGGVTSDGR